MRVNSSYDMLGLVAELNARRIPMIMGKMAQKAGGRLNLSKRELEWLQIARMLHHRYTIGDRRHDPNEAAKLHDLCQWLVDQHRLMQGRDAGEPITWDAGALEARNETTTPAKGDYAKMIDRVHAGEFDGMPES